MAADSSNLARPVQIRQPGYCALCRSRCGTINVVEEGRLIAVEPDPTHPTGGAMCRKGRAAPEMVYNPQRITRPLRRTTPKGSPDPRWEVISWDEALDEIADRMRTIARESGPQAIAFGVTTPAGTAMSDGIEWVERFVRTFGSPNICYATEICKWHQDYAHKFTFGVGIPTPDFKHSDLILIWGYNPSRTWLSQASRIGEAQRRGARLIVVDPRRTGHAQQADHWLRVRPGSDGILALSLASVLIEEELYDAGFIRSWTNGPYLVREDTGAFLRTRDLAGGPESGDDYLAWDERAGQLAPVPAAGAPPSAQQGDFALRGKYSVQTTLGAIWCRPSFELYAEACARFIPERAAKLTWVAEDEIRRAAHAIAAAKRVSYYAWTGVGQSSTATQTERAIALLYALTGCFDAEGGNVCFSKLPANRVNDLSLLKPAQRDQALGYPSRPLGPPSQGWITAADLYTSLLEGSPYRVRALIAFGGNMLLSQADPQRGREALASCEFHVHCELVETPTSRFADLVLPVATPWEREALRVGFDIDAEGEELVQLRPRMVEPVGEAKSDNWIVFELAKRLGLTEEFFGGEIDSGWNHMLRPLNLTVARLRERPEGIRIPLTTQFRKYALPHGATVRGFETQTRRVEIYSELLQRHRYEPVPRFDILETELSAGADAYPLTLTSAKNAYFCHTEHRNIASLRIRSLEPAIEMSPELARARNIEPGDWVYVETAAGRARFKAKLNGDLHPKVVVGEYGWWQECGELGLPGYDAFSREGSNLNNVISTERIDPISGSVPHRSFPCRITKVQDCGSGKRWSGFLPFVVSAIEKETVDAVSVTLRPLDGRALPVYRPGQHLTIEVRRGQDSPPVVRTYSLSAAAPSDGPSHYRITVKDTSDASHHGPLAGVSAYLNEKLRAGDGLRIQAPGGSFLLPLDLGLPVVLVAAGSGITPFMSFLETLSARGRSSGPVHLFYGNRNSRSHLFRSRLEQMERAGLVSVTNLYSRALPEDGGIAHIPGRLCADFITQDLIARRARFYLCGPGEMLTEMIQGLTRRGVPRFDIFQEVFSAPPLPVVHDAQAAHRVHFARSGRTLTWKPALGTLLESGEAIGLNLQNGCRVGQCESCALGVLSGTARHLNRPELDGEDHCLICQAIPSSDLVLDG